VKEVKRNARNGFEINACRIGSYDDAFGEFSANNIDKIRGMYRLIIKKEKREYMKSLLILGTVLALTFASAEANTFEGRNMPVARHVVTDGRTNRVAPARNRTVARRYSNRGYYGGGYHRYYYNRPSVAIGFGYPYGYPYGYYGYPTDYAYDYPNGYNGYAYNNDYPYSTYTTTNTPGDRAYYYSDNVVASVQARLANAGYYRGVVDGVAGPETRSAVALWEARHGMMADGNIDGSLLQSLGVS
jgi:hypothetical protein